MTDIVPRATTRSAISSLIDPLSFLSENTARFPDIWQSGLLNFSAYVINNPHYAQHILQKNHRNYHKAQKYGILRYLGGNGLVTNEGESWLNQRRLIQPVFHQQSLQNMMQAMVEETLAIRDSLSCHSSINMSEVLSQLTINIVSRTMFGQQAEGLVGVIRKEMQHYQKVGNILIRFPFPLPAWTPDVPILHRFKKSIQILRGIVMDIIQSRRNSTAKQHDLLQMLIDARDQDNGQSMSEEQLRDEVLTIFLAGHETTQLALTWSFYLLAIHPHEQLRVYQEVQHLADELHWTQLAELKYTECVSYEALRLYPPAYIIARTSIDKDIIDGYQIEANSDIVINVYGLHRHHDHWDQPEQFLPARFNKFSLKDTNKYLFMPFGGGQRYCIGTHFSLMEMKIILALFIKKFAVNYAEKHPIFPKPLLTLQPNQDLFLSFTQRN